MADPTQTRTLHLIIRGRVQGVFFRDSMRREAERLGVVGWVRNCGDGSVEATVQADPSAVEAMLRWARRGPPRAEVESVDAEPAYGDYASFDILYR